MKILHGCWLLAGRFVGRRSNKLMTRDIVDSSLVSKVIKCGTDDDLVSAGYNIGNHLEPGDVLLLSGMIDL